MTSTAVETFEAIELEAPLPEKSRRLSFHPSDTNLPQDQHTHSRETDNSHVRNEFQHNCSDRKSNLRTVATIFTPAFVSFMGSFSTGIITVGLPEIARSISLDRALYLWPSSVYGLTSGASLLIAGSVADIISARPVELAGIILMGIFSLACGLARSGEQLVVFRALQGVALAMHLPASVSLVADAVPSGRARNFGFACLGFSQPLGFAVGLVASGVMVERVGWRSGFYLTGSATLLTAVAAVWTLPAIAAAEQSSAMARLKGVGSEVDWIGAFISSTGLALLAYVLA